MRKVINYLLVFLLSFFFVRELSVIFKKSITCDEIVHIPADYFFVRKGDYFINYAHPLMYQAFMSIPEEKYYINSEKPKKEYIIISVNPLAGLNYNNHNIFWHLKERKTDAKVGYSIFVYDIKMIHI